jgi:hypothetical protein
MFLLQESRRVWGEDSHSFEFILDEKVRQAPRTIRKLSIAPAQDLPIRRHMVYRLGVGFYLGRAGEEVCRGSGGFEVSHCHWEQAHLPMLVNQRRGEEVLTAGGYTGSLQRAGFPSAYLKPRAENARPAS